MIPSSAATSREQVRHVGERRLMRVVRDERRLSRPRCGRRVLDDRHRAAVHEIEAVVLRARVVPQRGPLIERNDPLRADAARRAVLRFAHVHRPRSGEIAVRQHERPLGRVLVDEISRRPVRIRRQRTAAAVRGHVGVERARAHDVVGGRVGNGVDAVPDRRQVRRQRPRQVERREIRRDRRKPRGTRTERFAPPRQVEMLDGCL